jgi:hypothetical protein
MTISYESNGIYYIHGDTPISRLTPNEIGKVAGEPFYLNVFVKNKRGKDIVVRTFKPECGYIHQRDEP